MNFRPTKWKVIGIIIISIIISVVMIVRLVAYQSEIRVVCPRGDYIMDRYPLLSINVSILNFLIYFLLTFILAYIIWSLIQKINFVKPISNKSKVIWSIILSLIFFVIGGLRLLIDELQSQSFICDKVFRTSPILIQLFNRYESTSSVIYIPSILRGLFSPYMLVSSVILIFLIYGIWRVLEKSKFLKLDYRKLIVLLIITFPFIVFKKLNLLLFFIIFCGVENCNVAEFFYAKVFSFFILILVSYCISSLIVNGWEHFRKKLNFSRNRKINTKKVKGDE